MQPEHIIFALTAAAFVGAIAVAHFRSRSRWEKNAIAYRQELKESERLYDGISRDLKAMRQERDGLLQRLGPQASSTGYRVTMKDYKLSGDQRVYNIDADEFEPGSTADDHFFHFFKGDELVATIASGEVLLVESLAPQEPACSA